MKQKLDEYRAETLGRLEHEQGNRASRANDLRAQAEALDAENETGSAQMVRAKEPMPSDSTCPRCWIWDGESNLMGAQMDVDGVRFFECGHCGHTLEARGQFAAGQ